MITGAGGQLGQQVVSEFDNGKYKVFGLYNNSRPKQDIRKIKLNLVDFESVSRVFSQVRPDVVIHCAAATDVDSCEQNPDFAYIINHEVTGYLVDKALAFGAKMCYLSTDFVFDGTKGNYREDAETNPIQVYGKTKLLGELEVGKMPQEQYLIVRPSVIFSNRPGNFVSWIINSLKENKVIRIVEDQVVSPSYANDLAKKIYYLVDGNYYGVWNVSCSDEMSRLEMAQMISNKMGLGGGCIMPAKMSEISWVARRPKKSTLNTEKINVVSPTISFGQSLDDMGVGRR